ncbi:MAG: hypothetical protein AVDCRST_MAG52-1840, partial [uncultured Blastococcus sp.]
GPGSARTRPPVGDRGPVRGRRRAQPGSARPRHGGQALPAAPV